MEVKLAVLADAANISQEGKLNICGEFNSIYSASQPITWPLFTLVVRLETHSAEATKRKFAIDITDSDGVSIINQRIEGHLTFAPTAPGRPLRAQLIAAVQSMTFLRFGDYGFQILVDGQHICSVPVYVVKRPQPQDG